MGCCAGKFYRTIRGFPALTEMNTGDKGWATRVLVFMALTLLAGCAAAPPEHSPGSTLYRPHPVSKIHDRAPSAPADPPENIDPTVRRDTVPPTMQRPAPARPLRPLPQSQAPAKPQAQQAGPQASVPPAAPLPLQVCDAGGCFGPGGNRYGGGIGNIYLDGQGKPCQRTGNWMQCN